MQKLQITTAAGIIQQGSQPTISSPSYRISSAAQSLTIRENFSCILKTKGLSDPLNLYLSEEHLLVTTEIAGNLVKTLLDQQAAGADMISSKFGILHNLPLYSLQTCITLHMTMKAVNGSLSHYTKAMIP